MFVTTLMMLASSAFGTVVQIYSCEQDEATTDDQLEAMASEWLKAAKTVKGGENLELYLTFPIAASAGEIDVQFVLYVPNFAEWGAFIDNYNGSAAQKIDNKYEDDLDCTKSTLWDRIKIE